jgi:O-antigen/teichoic acid export membrane protein
MVTGAAAVIGISLNFVLIPAFGKMGAAASMLLAYFAMFLGITWKAQRVFPVVYQWRRVATVAATAAALMIVGKSFDLGLVGAIALTAAYPLVLGLTGFYLPQERARIGAFGRRFMLGRV